MNKKDFKKGATLYGVPTVNNRERKTKSFREFSVVKVGRVYVKLKGATHGIEFDVNISTGMLREDCNSGYLFFESIDDVNKHKENERKASDIRRFFDSSKKPTMEQVEEIHRILFN